MLCFTSLSAEVKEWLVVEVNYIDKIFLGEEVNIAIPNTESWENCRASTEKSELYKCQYAFTGKNFKNINLRINGR